MLYYDFTFYVYIENGEEEQPLLDTNFPDVSFQKEGIQIQTYKNGVSGCTDLRRISLWKVVNEFQEDGDQMVVPTKSMPVQAEAKHTESRREEDVKNSNSMDDEKSVSKSMDSGFRKSHPHHIAPLKSNAALHLKKMPDLGVKAPWDETGRPLGLRVSK